jgi:hypothetical protein
VTKITGYALLTAPATGDVLPIVDVSDTTMATSGTTKQVTVAALLALGGGGGGGGITLAGDLGGTSSVPQVIATHLGSPLPFSQGGTNATSASAALTALGAASASVLTAETARAEAAEVLLAPLASPALTGTPTAPTRTALTSSTALATTAYADSAVTVETTRATTAEGLRPATGSQAWLFAALPALVYTAITRNTSEAATSATVAWPDGTTGTYTADTLSSAFPGTVDAYHISYSGHTVTQPQVTRDASGAITAQPALTYA